MIRRVAHEEDYAALMGIWRRSVDATHHFIDKAYLDELETLIPSFFPSVRLYKHCDGNRIWGFVGVAEGKIEMLFVDPEGMGRGIGRRLVEFAVSELGATQVDVNEANAGAIAFYRKMGFAHNVGRSESDGMGRPYPTITLGLGQ